MDIYSIIILIAALTGFMLVAGGLYLIAKGLMKLAGDDSNTSVSVGKWLTVATSVPGLGIFIVGFIFIASALYFAGQRQDLKQQLIDERANAQQQIQEARADEDAKLQGESTLHLRGLIQAASDQDVLLSVCVGQRFDVQSNNPFEETIGPDYSDFLVVTLTSPGAEPQTWTIASPQMRKSFNNFGRLIIPQNGVGDMGEVKLQQVVDLTPAISQNKLLVPQVPGPMLAGTAYAVQK